MLMKTFTFYYIYITTKHFQEKQRENHHLHSTIFILQHLRKSLSMS